MPKKTKSKAKPGQVYDRREMEKISAYSGKLMKDMNFNSLEEANEFIGKHISGRLLDDIQLTPETPLEKAQSKMYDAFGATTRKKRAALAHEALEICPDCADAYVLLAEETARDGYEAIALYRQGIDAGRRALGEELFSNHAGNFWTVLEARPYMRALFGYAMNIFNIGEYDEAFENFRELMRLDKNDKQGVREFLAPALIEGGKFAEARQLLEPVKEEPSAVIKFSWALVLYLTEGASVAAANALEDALEFNHNVLGAIGASLNGRPLDDLREHIDSYAPGSAEEAVLYAADWFLSWNQKGIDADASAIEWLMLHIRKRVTKQSVFDTFPSLRQSPGNLSFLDKFRKDD